MHPLRTIGTIISSMYLGFGLFCCCPPDVLVPRFCLLAPFFEGRCALYELDLRAGVLLPNRAYFCFTCEILVCTCAPGVLVTPRAAFCRPALFFEDVELLKEGASPALLTYDAS